MKISCLRFIKATTTPSSSLSFKVWKGKPELITPANPTPYEFKPLSFIDEQDGLPAYFPIIQFYHHIPSIQGKNPVDVIKDAIARTLVFYYPFAGRLRERINKRLVVDCTSEGVMFMEADVNVTLEQYADPILPPFSCVEELIFNDPNSIYDVLNYPLLLFQVTRFQCGGFAVAVNINHSMTDAPGIAQFMTAVGEIARGAQMPHILPVWERQILDAHMLSRQEQAKPHKQISSRIIPFEDVICKSFFIGASEISALRSLVLHDCTSFEILTACLWKCRTIALQPHLDEQMLLLFSFNGRGKFNPPIFPNGYYGNGITATVASATAGEIFHNSLEFLAKLIRNAKNEVLKDFIRSSMSLTVTLDRVKSAGMRSFMVTDLRHLGLEKVDYGWGEATFGGLAKGVWGASDYVRYENRRRENGILVPIHLPSLAMETFEKELNQILKLRAHF